MSDTLNKVEEAFARIRKTVEAAKEMCARSDSKVLRTFGQRKPKTVPRPGDNQHLHAGPFDDCGLGLDEGGDE